MDLTSVLLRAAARRPHVLVVPAVGGTAARLSIEAAIARRAWPSAAGPADADIVVVAGAPGPELGTLVQRIWELVPAPRAHIVVSEPPEVDDTLDRAVALLADRTHQLARASGRAHGASPRSEGRSEDEAQGDRDGDHGHGHGHGHGDSAGHAEHSVRAGHTRHGGDHDRQGGQSGQTDRTGHGEQAGHGDRADQVGSGDQGDGAAHAGHIDQADGAGQADRAAHDSHAGHGDHDRHSRHGGHGNHGHGGGMEMPGGLPMADLGADRDGLTLDRLHVPLGPVLPDWPAGLVVRVVLQGDVIQEADAEVLDAGLSKPYWGAADTQARELDAVARFLAVAGWADAAAQARALRDGVLTGTSTELIGRSAAALVRRVRRSRTLRWLIRGIPAGDTDVAGLLEQRLAAIEAGTAPGTALPTSRPTIDELAGLLVGAELAAARLIVAAADPDIERVPAREGAQHG